MDEYTSEEIAALNQAAERYLSLYPLVAKREEFAEGSDAELYARVDKALSASVRAETDRNRKGRPAWHKQRRLATATTAEANWQHMRQKALQALEEIP